MGWLERALICMVAATAACSTTDPTLENANELEGIQRCDADGDCGGRTCCDGRCEDVSLSMRACGACGNTCAAPTYCTGSRCAPFAFEAICSNDELRIVHRAAKLVDGENDDPAPDNQAADDLAVALADLCNNTLATATVIGEDDVLEGANAGPLATGRGTGLIVAGGRVFSGVIDYLDNADVTPVELVVGGDGDSFQLVVRSQRRVIVTDRLTALSPSRDYIIGQAIYDDTSGTQVLNVYGIFRGGTSMGAIYFAELAAQSSAVGERWFVAKAENGAVTRLAGE